MKVTIWNNGKSRIYNADEIDVECFIDDDPNLSTIYALGETFEGQLSITGETPIIINTAGRVSENQIFLDQLGVRE